MTGANSATAFTNTALNQSGVGSQTAAQTGPQNPSSAPGQGTGSNTQNAGGGGRGGGGGGGMGTGGGGGGNRGGGGGNNNPLASRLAQILAGRTNGRGLPFGLNTGAVTTGATTGLGGIPPIVWVLIIGAFVFVYTKK